MWKKLFLRKRKVGNDKLTEAEKQGLITTEEMYRLRYERAKEDYADYIKKQKKK
jgi:hypothetical protein